MAKHALLSASGAHRWLECTPSALLELQFPQSTSEYAEEGTAAHELCELTARYFLGEVSEMDFENRRDELAKGPYYNAEMQECANDYARFVTEKTKAAQESCEDAFTELEVRVDFSKYVKDGFGTGDCIIVADKVLEIVDFKYGKGVRVEATGNPQMRLYAIAGAPQILLSLSCGGTRTPPRAGPFRRRLLLNCLSVWASTSKGLSSS